MTKEQTNEEINGKEMPLVSTFSLQDLIDEAVSQEKEKMIEKIKEQQESYEPAYEDVDHAYIRALKWTINLLQNK